MQKRIGFLRPLAAIAVFGLSFLYFYEVRAKAQQINPGHPDTTMALAEDGCDS